MYFVLQLTYVLILSKISECSVRTLDKTGTGNRLMESIGKFGFNLPNFIQMYDRNTMNIFSEVALNDKFIHGMYKWTHENQSTNRQSSNDVSIYADISKRSNDDHEKTSRREDENSLGNVKSSKRLLWKKIENAEISEWFNKFVLRDRNCHEMMSNLRLPLKQIPKSIVSKCFFVKSGVWSVFNTSQLINNASFDIVGPEAALAKLLELKAVFRNKESKRLSPICARDLDIFFEDVKRNADWAMKSMLIHCSLI